MNIEAKYEFTYIKEAIMIQFGMRVHDLCPKGPLLTVLDSIHDADIKHVQLAFGKSVSDYNFSTGHYSAGFGNYIRRERKRIVATPTGVELIGLIRYELPALHFGKFDPVRQRCRQGFDTRRPGPYQNRQSGDDAQSAPTVNLHPAQPLDSVRSLNPPRIDQRVVDRAVEEAPANRQQGRHHDREEDPAIENVIEADGEFHNYAQAEADMRDDSSDYISQLQREENRGHRITDEDFM
jgi:hypothetical protein